MDQYYEESKYNPEIMIDAASSSFYRYFADAQKYQDIVYLEASILPHTINTTSSFPQRDSRCDDDLD
jgi:hypothetical protein